MTDEKSKDENELRLNRYLAQCGCGSRRKCDELIAAGHILINGQKVTELGTRVHVGVDTVEYKGQTIKPMRTLEYLAYFKPRGVMVTREDPEGRVTVYNMFKSNGYDADHLNYVGRLDFNSEGLLLLTNDGDLIHALTHPRFHIKKVYKVRIDKPLTPEDKKKLIDGVESEGQILHAGDIRPIQASEGKEDQNWYEVDLFEGKNRQIRRMFESLGYDIRRLRRIQFGSVRLGDMQTGQYRPLTEKELGALKATGFKREASRR